MREAGWGPALPDPARARAPAHHRRPGLRGVSRTLPGGRPCADARRAGVRRAVLRVDGKGRALLLAARENGHGRGGLPTVSAERTLIVSPDSTGERRAGDCQAVEEVLRDVR